jgi:hypothetical protein
VARRRVNVAAAGYSQALSREISRTYKEEIEILGVAYLPSLEILSVLRQCVERILSVPVLLLRDSKYSI